MTEPVSFRTIVQLIALAIGLFMIIGYVTFQARFLIIGPQIVLTDEPTLLHSDRQVFLSGTAYNLSRLWLNDRPIYTDAEGNFKEAIVLENGYTVATLRAEDRYGRQTTVAQQLVYLPACFLSS